MIPKRAFGDPIFCKLMVRASLRAMPLWGLHLTFIRAIGKDAKYVKSRVLVSFVGLVNRRGSLIILDPMMGIMF